MIRPFTRICVSLTLLCAVAFTSPSFAGVNLLANPGFEDAGGSYNGWFTFGSNVDISTAANDNIFRSGAAASKIFGTFNGCPGAHPINVNGYGQAFTPASGMDYEFSGYAFMSSADTIPGTDDCNFNRAIAKVVFFDAASGGNELSANEIVIGGPNTVYDQWNFFEISAPVPSGALRVEALILYLQPGCDGGATFLDDLSFCEVTPESKSNLLANPSFTNGLIGWTALDNAFVESRPFIVRTPTGCAKIFTSGLSGVDSQIFQTVPATAGMDWKLDVWSMTSCRDGDPIDGSNDNFVLARISFKDNAGSEISAAETLIMDNTAPVGTWRKFSVVANAPTGTDTVQATILFVSPTLAGGAMWVDDVGLQEMAPVSVPRQGQGAFELYQNAPNPFAGSTRIAFALERRDIVDISVYDIAGRRVANLFKGDLEAGPHQIEWNGLGSGGERLAPGIYRYVLETSTGRTSKSLVLSE